jgi:hypothetical protein
VQAAKAREESRGQRKSGEGRRGHQFIPHGPWHGMEESRPRPRGSRRLVHHPRTHDNLKINTDSTGPHVSQVLRAQPERPTCRHSSGARGMPFGPHRKKVGMGRGEEIGPRTSFPLFLFTLFFYVFFLFIYKFKFPFKFKIRGSLSLEYIFNLNILIWKESIYLLYYVAFSLSFF